LIGMQKVVVVDDDADTRELLAMRLGVAGFEIHTAEDGADALNVISECRPDVVVLDWMMPKVDGLQVARQLHAQGVSPGVPVIMLTARSQGSDIRLGRGAGVTDYLVKPFSVREVVARVEARARARQQAAAADGAGVSLGFAG
jgi:DNA-binding response OmpR family regulator